MNCEIKEEPTKAERVQALSQCGLMDRELTALGWEVWIMGGRRAGGGLVCNRSNEMDGVVTDKDARR